MILYIFDTKCNGIHCHFCIVAIVAQNRDVSSDSSTMLALRTLCLRGAPRRSLFRKCLSSSSSIVLPPGSEPKTKAEMKNGGSRLLRELCAKIRNVNIQCCDISLKAFTCDQSYPGAAEY